MGALAQLDSALGLSAGVTSVSNALAKVDQTIGVSAVSAGLANVDKALGISTTITALAKDPLPMLATIALTSVGVPPMIANAVVSAANGGSIEQIATSMAMAYISTSVGNATGTAFDKSQFTANMSPALASTLKQVVTSASGNAAVAALQGKSITDVLAAAANAGVTSYVGQTMAASLGFTDPKKLPTSLVQNAVASATNAILKGKDIGSAITGSVTQTLLTEGIKTGVNKIVESSSTLKGLQTDFKAAASAADTYFNNTVKSAWKDVQAVAPLKQYADNAVRSANAFAKLYDTAMAKGDVESANTYAKYFKSSLERNDFVKYTAAVNKYTEANNTYTGLVQKANDVNAKIVDTNKTLTDTVQDVTAKTAAYEVESAKNADLLANQLGATAVAAAKQTLADQQAAAEKAAADEALAEQVRQQDARAAAEKAAADQAAAEKAAAEKAAADKAAADEALAEQVRQQDARAAAEQAAAEKAAADALAEQVRQQDERAAAEQAAAEQAAADQAAADQAAADQAAAAQKEQVAGLSAGAQQDFNDLIGKGMSPDEALKTAMEWRAPTGNEAALTAGSSPGSTEAATQQTSAADLLAAGAGASGSLPTALGNEAVASGMSPGALGALAAADNSLIPSQEAAAYGTSNVADLTGATAAADKLAKIGTEENANEAVASGMGPGSVGAAQTAAGMLTEEEQSAATGKEMVDSGLPRLAPVEVRGVKLPLEPLEPVVYEPSTPIPEIIAPSPLPTTTPPTTPPTAPKTPVVTSPKVTIPVTTPATTPVTTSTTGALPTASYTDQTAPVGKYATVGKMGYEMPHDKLKQLYESLTSTQAPVYDYVEDVNPEYLNIAQMQSAPFMQPQQSLYARGGLVNHFADGGSSDYANADVMKALKQLGEVGSEVKPSKHDLRQAGQMGAPTSFYAPKVLPQLAALLQSRGMKLAEGGQPDDHTHPNYDGTPLLRTGGLTGLGGKYVEGKGDGTSDDIAAMLANGEYVFSADVVAALGNGSNKAGAEELDRMVKAIRERARSAPSDKLPPDAKSPLEYLKSSKGNKRG